MFFNQPITIKDLTVRHGFLLMCSAIPGKETSPAIWTMAQSWISSSEDFDAIQELCDLKLVTFENGIFYRTIKGQEELDRMRGATVINDNE